MTETIKFKAGQSIMVTRRNGEVSKGTFVSAGKPGAKGSFDTVKLEDGAEIKARPSQIALAA